MTNYSIKKLTNLACFIFLMSGLLMAGSTSAQTLDVFSIDPTSGQRYTNAVINYHLIISYEPSAPCAMGGLEFSVNYSDGSGSWEIQRWPVTTDLTGTFEEWATFNFNLSSALDSVNSVDIQGKLFCGSLEVSSSNITTFTLLGSTTGGTGGNTGGGSGGGSIPSGQGTGPGFNQQSTTQIPPTQMTFGQLIKFIYDWSLRLLGVSVFVMILWAGFLWLTAAGNPGRIGKAKGIMFNAIIGAILLISAYLILKTINPDLVGGDVNQLPDFKRLDTKL